MRIRWTYVLSLVIMGKKGEKGGHSGKKGTCCFFSGLWVHLSSVRRMPFPYFHLSLRPSASSAGLLSPPARLLVGLRVGHCRLPFAVCYSTISIFLCVLCASAVKPPGYSGDRHFRPPVSTVGLRREA